jgi:putative ABC transport system ATP-binding protein
MIHSQDLQRAWPDQTALVYPDIALSSGEVLLLRGRSGSGKSTWLAMVSGLLTPTRGTLSVYGTEPARLSQNQRDEWRSRTIGFLPQGARLSPALTVRDNLRLVAYATGRTPDAKHQQALYENLGLVPLIDRRPAQLSGGQALRVALARALLHRPPLLLADEPTASLDDHNATQAMQLLREQANLHGSTLVVATHDQRAVLALPGARTLWLEGAA